MTQSFGSFCSKMVFCRLPTLMDLVIDEFRNAPLEIFIGCLTPVDFWIGWDSVVCAPISAHVASGGRDAKLRCLLTLWDMSVFHFHGEDSDKERHGG